MTLTRNQLIRLSEESSKAAHGLLLARVAIFDGQTKEAVKLVDQAKTAPTAAVQDADKLVIESQKRDAGSMILIDARPAVADHFTFNGVSETRKTGERTQTEEVGDSS